MTAKLALILFLAFCARSAEGQSIELSFDSNCTTNCGTISANTIGTLYISALQVGPAEIGVGDAQFRVTGIPDGWFYTCTPNPAAAATLGDPLDGSTGATIAFSNSQPGACLNLYTCRILATSEVVDRVLRVERRLPGCCPGSPCPLFHLNDPPMFTRICVNGGQALLNPSTGCSVGLAPATWSAIKRVYD